MDPEESRRAVAAAMSTAVALGLRADDAVVLSDSNRLVVQLLPCAVVARVADHSSSVSNEVGAALELSVARAVAGTDTPIAGLDPRVDARVFEQDAFWITFWRWFEPVDAERSASAYADALVRLHAGLRDTTVGAPHFMARVAETQRDVDDRTTTPDLADADRALLADTLRTLRQSVVDRRAIEQLLHGEPHPWNVLDTSHGLLFMDLENAAVGPVEYDLAWVPDDVSDRYPGIDRALLDDCRGIVLAIIAMHRWRVGDQHPSGRESGVQFLDAIRRGPPWRALDTV